MKANKMWLVLIAVMVLALSAISVNAAVTGCMDGLGAPSEYFYNDTGVILNVSAGNVCINETDYDVDPTAAVNCADNWANYTDGACEYTRYYVGYAGDGTATCVAAGWVVYTQHVFIAADYIINTTTDAEISGDYVTNIGEVATYDACSNAYIRQGPDGYCDGGGVLDTDDALLNVSAGNVCIAGADEDPTAVVFCSDSWANYTDGECRYTRFYVGYAGDGTTTCVATGWVVRTQNVYIAEGYIINTTTDALISGDYVTNTGESATYTICQNDYTRQGTDGYCDGGGALDINDSTLHVAAGKVCANGANLAPNATLKCGTWLNCVIDATSTPQYYVGYAASGTSCIDTSWVSAGTSITLATGLTCKTTEHAVTCPTKGYAPSYGSSDFSPIIMDAFGTAGAGVVSWADLAVTLLVILFIVGAVLKYKGVF